MGSSCPAAMRFFNVESASKPRKHCWPARLFPSKDKTSTCWLVEATAGTENRRSYDLRCFPRSLWGCWRLNACFVFAVVVPSGRMKESRTHSVCCICTLRRQISRSLKERFFYHCLVFNKCVMGDAQSVQCWISSTLWRLSVRPNIQPWFYYKGTNQLRHDVEQSCTHTIRYNYRNFLYMYIYCIYPYLSR